jgi:hypothetical protein
MRQIVIVLVCGLIGFLFSYYALPRKSEVVYNCDLAEISPDFPKEVKQQCRKIRNENSRLQ